MHKCSRKALAGCVLILLMTLSPAWAGHVITEEVRLWAREALQQEKALAASAAASDTIAVLNFANRTGAAEFDPLQKGLAVMLITDLTQVSSLRVVERVRMQALVEELGLGVSGLVETGTAPRVGRLLRARWLAGGGMTADRAPVIDIRADVLEVPDSQILGQPAAQGPLAELFRMEKEILFGILALLKVEPSTEEEEALRRPLTISLEAFLRFAEGIDASDRGLYPKAAELYEKALEADPGFGTAAEALEELRSLGLIPPKRRSGAFLRSLRDRTSLTDRLSPDEVIRRERTPQDLDQLPHPLPEPPPPPERFQP
ncbi:exported hypothetical protein [uncultured Desulfatiglans sp.]|nr:exported hypothetical protein [uncultured Desulfatiglans sp.]